MPNIKLTKKGQTPKVPSVYYNFNGIKLNPREHAIVMARNWQLHNGNIFTSEIYGIIVDLLSTFSNDELNKTYRKAGIM